MCSFLHILEKSSTLPTARSRIMRRWLVFAFIALLALFAVPQCAAEDDEIPNFKTMKIKELKAILADRDHLLVDIYVSFLAASASMRAASASAVAASTSSLRAVASLAASASRPARSTAAGEVRSGPVAARRADRFAAAAAAASARAAALSIMASTSRDTFVAASTRGAGEVRVGVAGSPPGEMDTERSPFDGSTGDEEISRSAMRSRASLIHSSASRPSADDFPVLHLEDVVVDVALSRCAAGVWKALSRPVERSSSKSSSPSSDEERASSPSARRRPVVDGDARAGDRHSSSRSQSSADRDPSAILEMLACGESARLALSLRAEKALAGLDGTEAASGERARGLRVGEPPSSSRARTSASGGVVGMFTP